VLKMFTSTDQIDGGVCGKPRKDDSMTEESSVEMASTGSHNNNNSSGSQDERNVAMAVDDSITSVNQSQNQSQLPHTQPWDNSAEDNLNELMSNEPQGKVWGQLYPTLGTFPRIGLIEDSYKIGRSVSNDYIVKTSDMGSTKLFQSISKKQCEIFKNENGVFIRDDSSNGTFVDGVKIGKGQSIALLHDSDISFANASCKVFVYRSSDAEKEIFPPELAQKYTVSKELGRGQYGTVRLAFRIKDLHRCAIKIVKKSCYPTTISIENEVKVLQKVRHPCIINLEDVIETKEYLYIVLELAEGGEMFTKIVEKTKMTEKEAKIHFYQIAHAIKYLHGQNICHRDLKPENILLSNVDDNDPIIKITDLGLSKLVNIGSELKTFCGTRNYLAPEVIESCELGKAYTFKVDCWSLGVILYILLSGSPPFCDNRLDKMNLRDQILKAKYTLYPQLFDHISDDAKDLIKKLLQKVPDKRLSSEEILEHPWLDDDAMKEKAHKLMDTQETSKPLRQALAPIEIPVFSPIANPPSSVTINKLKRLQVHSDSEETPSKRKKEDPMEN